MVESIKKLQIKRYSIVFIYRRRNIINIKKTFKLKKYKKIFKRNYGKFSKKKKCRTFNTDNYNLRINDIRYEKTLKKKDKLKKQNLVNSCTQLLK